MTLSMEKEKEFRRDSPFQNLSVYEYLITKTEKNRLTGGKVMALTIRGKYNKLFYNCDRTIDYNITNNLLIYLTAIRNISNFELKIDFQEKYNYNNVIPSNKNSNQLPIQKSYKKKIKLVTVVIIVIPIIIVILIIVLIIWYKLKKNKGHLYEMAIEDNFDAPPDYSINVVENEITSGYSFYNIQQQNPQSYQEYNDYPQNNNSNNYMFPCAQPYLGAYGNNN